MKTEDDVNDKFRKDPNFAFGEGERYVPKRRPSQNGQHAALKKRLIMSSRDFVAGYVAPQYSVEGVMQQRRLYSLTGKTGDGKTALQLYIAYLLATGTLLGEREVEKCRVLYLAGENPDDVRARWLVMSDVLNFDAGNVDVHFVEGVFSVSGMLERIKAEAEEIGGFGAVIVDTSAAYFEGDEENDNVQLRR
jgi:RecA-family ATPase